MDVLQSIIMGKCCAAIEARPAMPELISEHPSTRMGGTPPDPRNLFCRPPRVLSGAVTHFCAQITKGNLPEFVPCRPDPAAEPHMCFLNVETACAQRGGSSLFGWVIWIWDRTFIEAEHHAVWCQGGQLIDVTPNACGAQQIAFVRDPDAVPDRRLRLRRDNVRQPLRADSLVRQYLELSRRYIEIEELHTDGADVVLPPDAASELSWLSGRLQFIEQQMAKWSIRHLGRNEPCWCRSGRLHKRCCLGKVA